MLDTLVTQEGTMTGFSPVTIRNKNLGRVMQMLARQYTRPKDAVIRELLANGIDSHRKAGQSRPVLITLPTQNRSFLTIRDYGTGLDLSQMLETFCEFAETTKENDPEAIGFFGIGSKSPLAVADQFTVKAIKDGRAHQVLFVVQNGSPEHKVLDLGPTDEPNGVSVTVPTRPEELRQWKQAARSVLYWQDADSFELARPLEDLHNVAEEIIDEFSTANVRRLSVSHLTMVRMGGIGYEIPHSMIAHPHHRHGLVIQASPKTFELTPAREAIEDTAENRRKLKEVLERWDTIIEKELVHYFAQASTLAELYAISIQTPSFLRESTNVQKWYEQRMEEILPNSSSKQAVSSSGRRHTLHHIEKKVIAHNATYTIQQRRTRRKTGHGYEHEDYVTCDAQKGFTGTEFVELVLGKKSEKIHRVQNLFLDRPGGQLDAKEDKVLRDWMRLVLAKKEGERDHQVVVWDTSNPIHQATFNAKKNVSRWLDIEQMRQEVKTVRQQQPAVEKDPTLRVFTYINEHRQETATLHPDKAIEHLRDQLPVLITRKELERMIFSWRHQPEDRQLWSNAMLIAKGSRKAEQVSKMLGGIEVVESDQAPRVLKERQKQKLHEENRRQIKHAEAVFNALSVSEQEAALDGFAMTNGHRENLRQVLREELPKSIREALEPMIAAAQSPRNHREAAKTLSRSGSASVPDIPGPQDSMPLTWELLKKTNPSPELLAGVISLDHRG